MGEIWTKRCGDTGGWEELRPQGNKAGGAAGAKQPSEEGVPPTGKKGAPSADFV